MRSDKTQNDLHEFASYDDFFSTSLDLTGKQGTAVYLLLIGALVFVSSLSIFLGINYQNHNYEADLIADEPVLDTFTDEPGPEIITDERVLTLHS